MSAAPKTTQNFVPIQEIRDGVVILKGGGMRSLNVAQAGAMVLGEALRQTKGFP